MLLALRASRSRLILSEQKDREGLPFESKPMANQTLTSSQALASSPDHSRSDMRPLPLITSPDRKLMIDPANGPQCLRAGGDYTEKTGRWVPFDIRDLNVQFNGYEKQDKQLLASALRYNQIGLSQLQGPGFSFQLEPLDSGWTLLLAADGSIVLGENKPSLRCEAAQSAAFLPVNSGWRTTSLCRFSIGLHGSREALIQRLLAMQGWEIPVTALHRVDDPWIMSLTDPEASRAYQQLVCALHMLTHLIATSADGPHPFLNLDDLLLRAVALLICPEICQSRQDRTAINDRGCLQRAVRDLMDWMLASLDNPISLTDIEQRCHYGRRSIQVAFQQEVGCGPMQWLRRQRLQAAYARIQSAGFADTVSSLARQCGYLSLSSFSRDFNAMFKRTPSSLLRHGKRSSSPKPDVG